MTSSCAAETSVRTSSSIRRWVSSEVSGGPGHPSWRRTVIVPIFSLMPQRPTIWRAIWVSCWKSDSAPGRQIAEDDLLGTAAAERDLDLRAELSIREVEAVGVRSGEGDAE